MKPPSSVDPFFSLCFLRYLDTKHMAKIYSKFLNGIHDLVKNCFRPPGTNSIKKSLQVRLKDGQETKSIQETNCFKELIHTRNKSFEETNSFKKQILILHCVLQATTHIVRPIFSSVLSHFFRVWSGWARGNINSIRNTIWDDILRNTRVTQTSKARLWKRPYKK